MISVLPGVFFLFALTSPGRGDLCRGGAFPLVRLLLAASNFAPEINFGRKRTFPGSSFVRRFKECGGSVRQCLPVLSALVEYAPFLSLEMPSVFPCDVWEAFIWV